MLFKGPILEGKLLRHLCNNPAGVTPDHLVPGTPAENMQDYIKATGDAREIRPKLTSDEVNRIRELYAQGHPQHRLADQFGVCRQQISRIVRGKSWSSGEKNGV